MEPGTTWLYIRITIVAIGTISGILYALSSSIAIHFDLLDGLLVVILVPLGLLILIAFQAVNPFAARVWREPSWLINPFLFTEPLQFFHLAAFHFLAGGIGALLIFPFKGLYAASVAMPLLSAGIGAWIGVRLCMVVFRKKMEDT